MNTTPELTPVLHGYDPGDVEGYVDRSTGKAVTNPTPAMEKVKDDMNYIDPTGGISRRRVEGEWILSYYRNELFWRISRVDGTETPKALSGRYTSPEECQKGISIYTNSTKGNK